MPKGKPTAAATTAEESTQGRAVVLPNGEKRIDYIRDQFYTKGKTRSEIKTAINEMLPEGEDIPYQIVFAATKHKTEDPRIAAKAAAEQREKDRAAKAAAKEKEKAAADKKAAAAKK